MQQKRYNSSMFYQQFRALDLAMAPEFPWSREWLQDVPEFMDRQETPGRAIHQIEVLYKNIPMVLDMGEGRKLPYRYDGYLVIMQALESSYMFCDFMTDYYSEEARMRSRRRNSVSPVEAFQDPGSRELLREVAYRLYASGGANGTPVPARVQTNEQLVCYFMRQAGYQTLPECGNFKVSLAMRIYHFFQATHILDPFAGWGDRAIAAHLIPQVQRYHGVDSNADMTSAYRRMEADFGPRISFQKETRFERADLSRLGPMLFYNLVLASPPFYDLEVYGTAGLPEVPVEKWVDDWLVPCLERALDVLVEGGYLVLYLCDNQRPYEKRYMARCHDLLLSRNADRIVFRGLIATLRKKNTSRVMPLFIYQKFQYNY